MAKVAQSLLRDEYGAGRMSKANELFPPTRPLAPTPTPIAAPAETPPYMPAKAPGPTRGVGAKTIHPNATLLLKPTCAPKR